MTEATKRAVWRYWLRWSAEPQKFTILPDAKILHVGLKPGAVGRYPGHRLELHMWVEVELDGQTAMPVMPAMRPERTFQIFGTGDPDIPPGAVHIGSVVEPDDPMVWHVYELLDVVEKVQSDKVQPEKVHGPANLYDRS
jgi:hypothetical protein